MLFLTVILIAQGNTKELHSFNECLWLFKHNEYVSLGVTRTSGLVNSTQFVTVRMIQLRERVNALYEHVDRINASHFFSFNKYIRQLIL